MIPLTGIQGAYSSIILNSTNNYANKTARCTMQNLGFSQHYCCGIKSFGMWCGVTGRAVPSKHQLPVTYRHRVTAHKTWIQVILRHSRKCCHPVAQKTTDNYYLQFVSFLLHLWDFGNFCSNSESWVHKFYKRCVFVSISNICNDFWSIPLLFPHHQRVPSC